MNTREEFEKFIADYDNYDFAFITEMWQAWQEQQKKIDDLQLKLDIKDDAIRGCHLVIEELKSRLKLHKENDELIGRME